VIDSRNSSCGALVIDDIDLGRRQIRADRTSQRSGRVRMPDQSAGPAEERHQMNRRRCQPPSRCRALAAVLSLCGVLSCGGSAVAAEGRVFLPAIAPLSRADGPSPPDVASPLLAPEMPPAEIAPVEMPPADEAAAEADARNPPDFGAQLEALRTRIAELEAAERKRQEAADKPAASRSAKTGSEPKSGAGTSGAGKSGAAPQPIDWTDLSTEKWTVKLGGHFQLEYVDWINADRAIPDTKNYFEFRRLRLLADGTGYGVYDFRLQMTLEPETVGESPAGTVTSPDVKDVYFSINEVPWLGRVRIGNFFVPFSLEQVTNDTNNIFMERSLPTQGVFSPDREVGIALYNATEDRRFTWSTGAFIDSISEGLKERIDDNQGYRLSGRVTWLPFYDEPSDGRYLIHTGAGVLYTDDQDGRVRLRARPQIHEGPRLIDSGVIAADNYVTGNLEGAVVWGPVTLQSELFLSNINRRAADDAAAWGGYAHLSWFLTGENRIFERFGQHGAQFGRNVPFTNVFAVPGGVGWGAWELKARYSHLNLTRLRAGEYHDVTVGCNWYWSDRVRTMFDWIHPLTSSGTTFGRTQSDLLALRFDVNW